MSPRTFGSIAALFVIGMACIATVSTPAFARAPAGTTRLHHHHHHHRGVHHSGQVQHGNSGNMSAPEKH
jgi:hypothetical protein